MLMPAIIVNSSPNTWPGVPMPPDAMLSLAGLALAWAMSSGTVVAGTDGFTTMTLGTRVNPATGAISRMKLKLSLLYRVVLTAFVVVTKSSVYPSGGAFTTASVAILAPAPG